MTQTPEKDGVFSETDLHVQATYRLTEALITAENQMSRRIDLLSEIVFEADQSGTIVFLNKAWTKTLGYGRADSLGLKLSDYIVQEDLHILEQILTELTPISVLPLLRMRSSDGGFKWMEMSIDRIAGGGMVGAIRDVTQKKLAQDEAMKLSLVASYTSNMVIITDRDGQMEWANQAFSNRTGYLFEDFTGLKPGNLLQGPDTDQNTVRRVGEQLREGISFSEELLNYTKTGEKYWVKFQITPIRNAQGEIDRFVSIQTDTTELHQIQADLKAAKQRAELASEAKTHFLATISHEMRTPLHAIIGSTDLALDGEVDLPELRTHVARINDNAEILLRLITDMLDVSKIEAGQIDLDSIPFNIRECLHSAVAEIAERAREKGLDFRLMFDELLPARVLGDPGRLRQIVNNLSENAVKFTDKGYMRVEVSRTLVTPGSNQAIEIRVVDSGIGIDREAQTYIFERFRQVDNSTSRHTGGTGLGLSIVKSLVEAFGGTVTVSSFPGNGSTFRVTLPLEEVSDLPKRRWEETSSDLGSLPITAVPTIRILVAEDNDNSFSVMQAYLLRAGYAVDRAINGQEAILAASRCDLILMDLEMPGVDGFEAVQRIRARERQNGLSPIPVLAVTAHAVRKYKDHSLSIGFTGYLSKPIRKQLLLEEVKKALLERQTSSAAAKPDGVKKANYASNLIGSDSKNSIASASIDDIASKTASVRGPICQEKIRFPSAAKCADRLPEYQGAEFTGKECISLTPIQPSSAKQVEKTDNQNRSASNSRLPLQVPILDDEALKELMDVLPMQTFNLLLGKFRAELESTEEQFLGMLQDMDLATIGQVAHNTLGTAAVFGAKQLHEILGELENACEQGESDRIHALIVKTSSVARLTLLQLSGK